MSPLRGNCNWYIWNLDTGSSSQYLCSVPSDSATPGILSGGKRDGCKTMGCIVLCRMFFPGYLYDYSFQPRPVSMESVPITHIHRAPSTEPACGSSSTEYREWGGSSLTRGVAASNTPRVLIFGYPKLPKPRFTRTTLSTSRQLNLCTGSTNPVRLFHHHPFPPLLLGNMLTV